VRHGEAMVEGGAEQEDQDRGNNAWKIATPLITTFVAVGIVFYSIYVVRRRRRQAHDMATSQQSADNKC
jgi:hypothetical protein